jgi:uncharacterized membrane protein (UPF0127 family)
MLSLGPIGYAFNRTRQAYLATQLSIAETHWSRFRGLMGAGTGDFPPGQGLWIVPSHGVHTLGMRFSIDVAYLDSNHVVVHIESGLKPWRVAPIRLNADSVLELPENTLAATGTRVGDQIKIAQGKVDPDDQQKHNARQEFAKRGLLD